VHREEIEMRTTLVRIAATVAPLLWLHAAAVCAADKPKPDDMVNDPPFASWSRFPVGTSVTQQETVKLDDGSTVAVSITSKLLEKTKDKVVVETSMGDAGAGAGAALVGGSTTTTTYPAMVKMSAAQTPDVAMKSVTQGTEAIEWKGKTYTTEWVEAVSQNGDETTTEKMWTVDDVPGGMLKETIVKKKGDKVVSDSQLNVVDFKSGS
jgi:hypothetical protein